MAAAKSEYLKQRLSEITDEYKTTIRSRPIKRLKDDGKGRNYEIERLITESTGADGEIYGYRD